jgi:protein TonB
VKEVPKPAKPTKKKDEPKTKRAPETPPPAVPSEAAAPDAPIGGAPPGPAGAGITSLDPVDASLAWYHDTVNAALDRNWIRPPLEDAGGTVYAVVVAFEIARDGSVRGVKVESSSGVQVVDLSAVRAVRDSAPFPPPPPGRRDETVRARIRFEYDPGRE